MGIRLPEQSLADWDLQNAHDDEPEFECSESETCDFDCADCVAQKECFSEMSNFGEELFGLGEVLARAQGGLRRG